ncbi:type II 3-dehydroquinate dehydratase [Desulfothermus naphthae]
MSKKYKILIINGPNLRYLGKREPEIYGNKKMQDVVLDMGEYLKKDIIERVDIDLFQSNHEGEIIDRLERAWLDKIDGIVINAGAYTHTSLAIRDCIAWIKIPCVEVHISNLWAREENIRHKSMLSPKCIGVVSGFGVFSYVLAILALVEYLDNLK